MFAERSILFTKVGNTPQMFGIVQEFKSVCPQVRVLGITDADKNSPHVFDEAVASSDQLLLGDYEHSTLTRDHIPPNIFSEIEPEIHHLLRLADRVYAYDLNLVVGDRPLGSIFPDSYNARLNLVLRHLIFWYSVLENRNVSAVVFPNLPHGIWDASLMSLARARKIPCMHFHEVPPFIGSLYMYEKPGDIGNLHFGQMLLDEARRKYGLVPDSSNRLEKLRQGVSGDLAARLPSGISRRPMSVRIANILELLLKEKFGHRLKRRVTQNLSYQRSLRSERKLHYQGEIQQGCYFHELQLPGNATTLVKGRSFPRQLDMIRHIAEAIPDDKLLFIRESPRFHARKLTRPSGFWTEIARIPNVRVVGQQLGLEKISDMVGIVVELGYSSLALHHLKQGKVVVFLGATHLGRIGKTVFNSEFQSLSKAFSVAERILSDSYDARRITNDLENQYLEVLRSTIEGVLSWYPDNAIDDLDYQRRLHTNVGRVLATWFSRFSEAK